MNPYLLTTPPRGWTFDGWMQNRSGVRYSLSLPVDAEDLGYVRFRGKGTLVFVLSLSIAPDGTFRADLKGSQTRSTGMSDLMYRAAVSEFSDMVHRDVQDWLTGCAHDAKLDRALNELEP